MRQQVQPWSRTQSEMSLRRLLPRYTLGEIGRWYMRKVLSRFTEFVGKTVEGVFDDIQDDSRILTFTDGTCAAIRSESGYDGERELPELTTIEPCSESHVDRL